MAANKVSQSGKKWEDVGYRVWFCPKSREDVPGEVPVFNGRHALSLDAKGRLAIPTRFREKLKASCGGALVLTQHPYDLCLSLYPEPEWNRIAADVARLSDAHAAVRVLKRRFLGQAVDLEIDGNGRILVPNELRTLADLDKSVMLIGQVHRFEIWSEKGWAGQMDESLTETLPEEVQSLSF